MTQAVSTAAEPASTTKPASFAALALMAASGFAGLGYQIVWTQQGALWLGHESAAVLAVVTAFFGGLALGALSLGPRIERSERPVRWYAACEAVIGLWGAVLVVAMAPASGWLLDLVGPEPAPLRQAAVAFIGTFVLLLPATAAMGATLPAMERVASRGMARGMAQEVARVMSQVTARVTAKIDGLPTPGSSIQGSSIADSRIDGSPVASAPIDGSPMHGSPVAGSRFAGRSIAALYAANTFGAVVGVLATAFWSIPALGLAGTAGVCIALNLACAGAASRLLPTAGAAAPGVGVSSPSRLAPSGSGLSGIGPAMLAATGLLGIGYEVVVVRVLSQVTEETVYTFAMLLAVYLVGTALGAAAYQRWWGRMHGTDAPDAAGAADALGDRLLGGLAAACLIGTASLWAAERIRSAAVESLGNGIAAALGNSTAAALGNSMTAALGGEATLALAAFGLPTFAMGALFSHLAGRAAGRENTRGIGTSTGTSTSTSTGLGTNIGFGRALGINTLGAAAAPVLFGVLLAPALGSKAALLLIVAGYLALGARRAWRRPVFGSIVVATIAIAWWAPPLAFVDVPEGGRIVSYREGAMAAVSVVEDADGIARLRIDNRQQEGSSATRRVDGRQALLPLLLHPAPKRALFLGLGTGVTAGVAAEDPTLQVDAVELLPEVVEASRWFAASDGQTASRPRPIAADARRFVRTTAQHYDVIVSDNFHPARSGSGALYTTEHFEAVRARLAEGGIFCQWLPLHQLDVATLRSIVRSFLVAFPAGRLILASNSLETPVIGLVGHAGTNRLDIADVQRRLRGAAWPGGLAEFGIDDAFSLLGSFVAGPASLARFAGDAPLNTDDRPVVAYRAPRIAYAPDSLPRERLLALLKELGAEPAEVVDISIGGTNGSTADISNGGTTDRTTDRIPDTSFEHRLAAYRSARDRFIAVGQTVRPSADVHAMLAQVRGPLLAVLRISPDFRPAYDPLLRMATALAQTDRAAGTALLAELVQVQPARPEAAVVLDRLARTSP